TPSSGYTNVCTGIAQAPVALRIETVPGEDRPSTNNLYNNHKLSDGKCQPMGWDFMRLSRYRFDLKL
ncbi:hypothetical protein, partial [Desulfosporosinus metallidurans]|uniref:hypothetical protein n=1 Tax=Desulfosporosinus metallidurans TaxID=1888891 RepID=UPI001A9A5B24